MVEKRKKLLTISQAANLLGIHDDTLRAWADKGLIPVIRTPTGYRRFDPEVIERFQEEMGMESEAKKIAA